MKELYFNNLARAKGEDKDAIKIESILKAPGPQDKDQTPKDGPAWHPFMGKTFLLIAETFGSVKEGKGRGS